MITHKLNWYPFFLFISLPWNQNTPIGYFAEVLYQMIAPDAFYITHGSVLLLFISICWHHKAFEQIIRHMMNQFDHLETDRNYKKSLCQIIQFHITVKKLVQSQYVSCLFKFNIII